MDISIFNACMNRQENLEKALPTWLACKEVDEIVILDWSSREPIKKMTDHFRDPRIKYVYVAGQTKWVLTKAYNLAARMTTKKKILKLDTDNLLAPDFFANQTPTKDKFLTGDWRVARDENEAHLNGVIFLLRDAFFKVNGYDERIDTYGWDDSNLYDRLEGAGCQWDCLDLDKIQHIPHDQTLRCKFQEIKGKTPEEEIDLNKCMTEKSTPWGPQYSMTEFCIEAIEGVTTCREILDKKNPLNSSSAYRRYPVPSLLL